MHGLTRRRLFSRAKQVGAGLTAWRWGAAAPGKRVSKMRFGFTSYQWGSDWDIPTLIRNCTKAKAYGVELRTSANYAHGVELSLSEALRREVKKRFADSPVALIGIASAERFDWPDPAKLNAAIENAKAHVRLSQDVGSRGVRVFPNDFHKEVPQENTIEQISRALNMVGKYAAAYGLRPDDPSRKPRDGGKAGYASEDHGRRGPAERPDQAQRRCPRQRGLRRQVPTGEGFSG